MMWLAGNSILKNHGPILAQNNFTEDDTGEAPVKKNGHFTVPVLHSANLVDHNFLPGVFLAGNNG